MMATFLRGAPAAALRCRRQPAAARLGDRAALAQLRGGQLADLVRAPGDERRAASGRHLPRRGAPGRVQPGSRRRSGRRPGPRPGRRTSA